MQQHKDILATAVKSILVILAFTFITGIIYPFVMTGISQVAFPEQANGEIVTVHDRVAGSRLIGQDFNAPGFFHSRPSAVQYAANGSGASNYGPVNPVYLNEVRKRVSAFRSRNGLSDDTALPADIVLASGSGLDPHISLEAALLQVPRVASEQGLEEGAVRDLVLAHNEKPFIGIPSQDRVNVLEVNTALIKMVSSKR